MISIFLLLILFINILLSYLKSCYGLGWFIAIRILVPEFVRTPGVDMLSLNSANILIVLIFVLWRNTKILSLCKNDKYIRCLLLFVLWSSFSLILSAFGNYFDQIKLIIQFLLTDILPICLAIIIIKNKKSFNTILYFYLLSLIISCCYGIFSYVININPYVFGLKLLSTDEYVQQIAEVSGRGYGTSATFSSTNGFGYFISMSIPLCTYLLYRGYKTKLSIVALALLIINLFLCKKRSPLVSMGVFMLFLLYFSDSEKKVKYIIGSLLAIFVVILSVEMFPSLSSVKNMIETSFFFWDDKVLERNDVGGSSWELRLLQLYYPFIEIKDNLLFGHGAGWCGWYLNEFKLHPILFGFETIFSTAICEYGIFGYFIYYFIFEQSYIYSRVKPLKGPNFQLLNLIAEIVLIIATGLNYFYFWDFPL